MLDLDTVRPVQGHDVPRASPGRRLLPLLGPAFVAAVAYVDPGNFATNFDAGATFGYLLIWVVVLANVIAMLVQYLSAKLGLATGRSLAEVCRDQLPSPLSRLLWIQAELVAMATDFAEFVGAAIALQLLFGLPPLPSGLVTAAASMLLLSLRARGRPFETVVIVLLTVIMMSFGWQLLVADPVPSQVAAGLLPRLGGAESLMLASGIVGATVMPHAVFVHSALAARAVPHVTARRRLAGIRLDVILALGLAGLVNIAMMVVSAAMLRGQDIEGLEGVYRALGIASGSVAVAFALALLASGLSSSAVGTFAGEVIMDGFLRRRIRPTLRRVITMLPALALLGSGMNTGTALVLSQVVLSFGIPFTLLPLVAFTAREDLMGGLVNLRRTSLAGSAVALAVIGLNSILVHQLLTN
jgi:manganese transport protein